MTKKTKEDRTNLGLRAEAKVQDSTDRLHR